MQKAVVALAYQNRRLRPRHPSTTTSTRAWASSLVGTAPMNAPGRTVTAFDRTYPSGRCISLDVSGEFS